MEQKHGYSYLSGLVEYRQGRQIITPYNRQNIQGPFLAVTRYEKDNQSLEILYGDKEFAIESYLYYDQVYRLSLGQMLAAVKKSDAGPTRHWLVTHEDLIVESIAGIARTVKKQWRHFLCPTPKIIERALTIRGKLMEQAVREQHKQDIEDASREAARAFMEKDFLKVIALLVPYERHLSASDLKKLTLARRNLLESATS